MVQRLLKILKEKNASLSAWPHDRHSKFTANSFIHYHEGVLPLESAPTSLLYCAGALQFCFLELKLNCIWNLWFGMM